MAEVKKPSQPRGRSRPPKPRTAKAADLADITKLAKEALAEIGDGNKKPADVAKKINEILGRTGKTPFDNSLASFLGPARYGKSLGIGEKEDTYEYAGRSNPQLLSPSAPDIAFVVESGADGKPTKIRDLVETYNDQRNKQGVPSRSECFAVADNGGDVELTREAARASALAKLAQRTFRLKPRHPDLMDDIEAADEDLHEKVEAARAALLARKEHDRSNYGTGTHKGERQGLSHLKTRVADGTQYVSFTVEPLRSDGVTYVIRPGHKEEDLDKACAIARLASGTVGTGQCSLDRLAELKQAAEDLASGKKTIAEVLSKISTALPPADDDAAAAPQPDDDDAAAPSPDDDAAAAPPSDDDALMGSRKGDDSSEDDSDEEPRPMDEDEAPVEPFEPELAPTEPPALMVSASLVLDDAGGGAVYRSGADNRRATSLLTATAGAVRDLKHLGLEVALVDLGETGPLGDVEARLLEVLMARLARHGDNWRRKPLGDIEDDMRVRATVLKALGDAAPKPTHALRDLLDREADGQMLWLQSRHIDVPKPIEFGVPAHVGETLSAARGTCNHASSIHYEALSNIGGDEAFDYEKLHGEVNRLAFESRFIHALVERRLGLTLPKNRDGDDFVREWYELEYLICGHQATAKGLVLRPKRFAAKWKGMVKHEEIALYYGAAAFTKAAAGVFHPCSIARASPRCSIDYSVRAEAIRLHLRLQELASTPLSNCRTVRPSVAAAGRTSKRQAALHSLHLRRTSQAMADQATAHALDGTHRVIRCPLNLDHVQNVDLAVNDEGELEGQSNVMKYTCKKLEPPKDDPHARWAVGVYDKTTGRVDFKYADEFDMYADPLQAKAPETGSALPEGDWLDKKIAIADAFQTPKAQRQLRQRAANRVAPEATFGGADLSSTVKELEEKAQQVQAEEEKSGLEVVSTTFDNAFAAHSASLDAQKRALQALASERGRDSWVPEAWPVFIVSLLKDADEAQTRDLLLARHLLEFRSLDQKGTCRVVAVARERQMPEAVLGAILETYAQASKTAAGSYRYDCRAAPLQDALTVAVLFALLRAGGGRLRVEDAARALRATVKRCTALLKARLGCAVSAKRKRGQPHETTARLPGVEEAEEAAAEGG